MALVVVMTNQRLDHLDSKWIEPTNSVVSAPGNTAEFLRKTVENQFSDLIIVETLQVTHQNLLVLVHPWGHVALTFEDFEHFILLWANLVLFSDDEDSVSE